MKNLNQSGFAALWIVVLLLAGITAGTLLVQNGVNFLPKADEITESLGEVDESGANCNPTQAGNAYCVDTTYVNEFWGTRENVCRKIVSSQINAPNCSPTAPAPQTPAQEQKPSEEQKPQENPVPPPPPEINTAVSDSQIKNCADEACKNRACETDKVIYCDNREGKPRAIRKTGGYFDSPTGKCVFDFFEVPEKNSECGKSESKSGDVVSVSAEEERRIDQNRNSTLSSRQSASSSTGSAGSNIACSTDPKVNSDTEKSFIDAKVANNLVRFYSILEGAPGLCVPADLGVPGNLGQPIQETADAQGSGNGRLLLCSDRNDGNKLVWNVIVGKDLKPAKDKPTPINSTVVDAFTATGRLPNARKAAGL